MKLEKTFKYYSIKIQPTQGLETLIKMQSIQLQQTQIHQKQLMSLGQSKQPIHH